MWFFSERDDRLIQALALLAQINRKVDKIMATEQDLLTQIAGLQQAQKDEADNLATLSANLDALIAKLQASGSVPQADIDALAAVKSALDASNAALLAAAQKAGAA